MTRKESKDMTTFSERLDALLHEYDMNRSQLARRLNVDVSTVHRWFKRGSIPNRDTVVKIARIFRVDEDYLYGNSDDPNGRPDTEPFLSQIEEDIKENELNQELVSLIANLTPAQMQRVKDFVAGLKG